MAFDSPSLGGHTFENPPDTMDVSWDVIQQMHNLADGGVRQRILGYKLVASLNWSESWIKSQDLTGIISVANDLTGASGTGNGALTFVPRPQSKPSLTFDVIWRNKLDFKFHRGDFGTYEGTIQLVSAVPTSTVSDLP